MVDRQNGLIALFVALLSASCGDDGGSSDASAAEDGGRDAGEGLDSDGSDAGPGPDGAAADASGDADQDGAVDEVDPTVLTNFSFDAERDAGRLLQLRGRSG